MTGRFSSQKSDQHGVIQAADEQDDSDSPFQIKAFNGDPLKYHQPKFSADHSASYTFDGLSGSNLFPPAPESSNELGKIEDP